MAVLVILGLAIGLQVITAIVVRRFIRVTGRHWGWVALAAVVVLLTGWRCAIVLRGVFAGVSAQPDLATEGLVLLISICMVSGLAGIASLMLSIQRAQARPRRTARGGPRCAPRADASRAHHCRGNHPRAGLRQTALPDCATGGRLAGGHQECALSLGRGDADATPAGLVQCRCVAQESRHGLGRALSDGSHSRTGC